MENTVLSPDLVIENFAQKLSLEPAVCQRAVNTVKKAKELDGMSSLLPQTLAGAVLLLAVKVSKSPSSRDSTEGEELPHADITADSMAELSELSSATLKKVHKQLPHRRTKRKTTWLFSSYEGWTASTRHTRNIPHFAWHE